MAVARLVGRGRARDQRKGDARSGLGAQCEVVDEGAENGALNVGNEGRKNGLYDLLRNAGDVAVSLGDGHKPVVLALELKRAEIAGVLSELEGEEPVGEVHA